MTRWYRKICTNALILAYCKTRLMMKRLLWVGLLVTWGGALPAWAQLEGGFTLGIANAMTDLGGGYDIGKFGLKDLDLAATRPALGVFLRHTPGPYFSARAQLSVAWLVGDDDYLDPNTTGAHLARWYRNQDFKATVIELALLGEFNIMRFEHGRYRYRQTPYLVGGFALFWMDPRARDGTRLKPLRTEGQGLPQYPDRKPYASIQPAIPLGLGYKYNINQNWTIGFELVMRFTFTDYLDDVSKTYPDPAYYYQEFPEAQAQVMDAYSNRWRERCETGDCLRFQPGDQRGDPTDNDHYAHLGMITISYLVKRGRIYCPKF